MKFTVLGFGQCGGRLADQFALFNRKARNQRGIEIAPAVLAINTDAADLSGLQYIPHDYQHRIMIGGRRTGGHGVGKINELAAEIAKQDSDRIFYAIRSIERAFESDAFLLAASAAGGTGSGSIAVTAQILKSRYANKPLYVLAVLPFEHEELTEERTFYNTAICLKSVSAVADAFILADNQRFVGQGSSLQTNFREINRIIVEPFFDLLCAGEETRRKHIGTKTLDAGDIAQTLNGWTVIGYGRSQMPVFNLPFRQRDFKNRSGQTQKGIEAMNKALSDLSVGCDPADTRKALYLLSGPAGELNMDLAAEVGEYLRGLLPKAIIRNGDYPRERASLRVHLVLSALTYVQKVKDYYTKSTRYITEFQNRKAEGESELKQMEAAGKDLPVLL